MGERPERVAMLSDIRREVTALRTQLSARIDDLDRRMTDTQALIKEEAETTRRHFDVMVEKVEASVQVVAEVNAHHALVLDNHEKRLNAIEKAR